MELNMAEKIALLTVFILKKLNNPNSSPKLTTTFSQEVCS